MGGALEHLLLGISLPTMCICRAPTAAIPAPASAGWRRILLHQFCVSLGGRTWDLHLLQSCSCICWQRIEAGRAALLCERRSFEVRLFLLWRPGEPHADAAVAVGSRAHTLLFHPWSRKPTRMLPVRGRSAAHERRCFRCGACVEVAAGSVGAWTSWWLGTELGLALQIYTMLVGWAFSLMELDGPSWAADSCLCVGEAERHIRVKQLGIRGSGMGNTQPSPPPSAPTGINLLPFKSPWG